MKNYYIVNKSKMLLYIQDSAGKNLFSISPGKCTPKPYSEEFIIDNVSIQSFLKLGYVYLSENKIQDKVNVIKDNVSEQKYKNGSSVYTKDRSRLELTVIEYIPAMRSYKLRINKTGAEILLSEGALSASRYNTPEISPDDDEERNNQTYLDKEAEISNINNLPVNLVRTEPVEAKAIDANDKILSQELDNNQVEIITTNKPGIPQMPLENENTYIVKADNQIFAKEVPESQIVQNTQKEINNVLEQAAKEIKKQASQQEISDAEIVDNKDLSENELQYLDKFNALDNRTKKMNIARLQDVEKLNLLTKHGDEMAKKLAQAKLSKINVK